MPDGLSLGSGIEDSAPHLGSITRTWSWREVAKVSIKEAEKLLKVIGNHIVLEL